MREVAATAAFLATVTAFGIAKADHLYSHRTYVLFTGDQPVCQEALKRVQDFSVDRYYELENLGEVFDNAKWHKTTVVHTDNKGRSWPYEMKYQLFDVNNDGRDELILAWRAPGRHDWYDQWWLLPAGAKDAAARNELSGETLRAAERINEHTIDGEVLGESLMYAWRHADRNYVVFQSVTFGNRGAYLLVTRYQDDPYKDGGRWYTMKVVCGIRS